ncbi:MAG TPA: helix-turn-helix domain-containing protein [Allosphingosinicella sp.]|nr:helix-turn-helix domain-containing protein [Allosphingosinicella sp.]
MTSQFPANDEERVILRARMVDTAAAAQYVGLAKNTLEKMRLYGGGPRFSKYGRAVRYSVPELDAWIEKNSAASTSEHWRAA